MSGEAYNWVSLGPSIRATGGVLLKSGGLVRKGENCTAGSPAPTMESPCPPGFRGVVGPLGSFHQQLRASALDPAAKASIPAPLPSNELGVDGLLRNGLPCRSKLTPVLLVMKRVFAKVIAPKVFMFAPAMLLANRQLSTYSQLSVLITPKDAFSIVQYSRRQPVVELTWKSKPSQGCPFRPRKMM